MVRDGADRPDRAAWETPPAVPLTVAESTAWERADSIGRNPPFLVRVGESVGAVVGVVAAPGFFHYNRVDGYYLGAAHDWRAGPGAAFTTRAGYALGSEVWQYRVGGQVRLSEAQRLWVGAWYHDETVAHPTLISSEYNPTFRAVFARVDPLDYYRERGVSVSLGMKLLDLTRLDLGYDDARQTSLDTLPGYSFRSSRYPPRGNLPIADGHLRSVSAALSYDSREFLRNRGEDYRLSAPSWTRVSVGVEAAAPSVIADDFSYRRYTLQLERAQPLLGFGTTTVSASGRDRHGPGAAAAVLHGGLRPGVPRRRGQRLHHPGADQLLRHARRGAHRAPRLRPPAVRAERTAADPAPAVQREPVRRRVLDELRGPRAISRGHDARDGAVAVPGGRGRAGQPHAVPLPLQPLRALRLAALGLSDQAVPLRIRADGAADQSCRRCNSRTAPPPSPSSDPGPRRSRPAGSAGPASSASCRTGDRGSPRRPTRGCRGSAAASRSAGP